MKSNDVAGIGNFNTAEFWEYNTRTGRRLNLDPVVHPWESRYATFGSNPILYSDVDGDDWFKDKNGNVRYSPSVKKKGDVGKGEKYLGSTFEDKKLGKIHYRKDGSALFENETDAYRNMWERSKEPMGGTKEHELLAFIGKKGVLVLPDYLNNSTGSWPGKYNYLNGGNLFDPVTGTVLSNSTIATIHIHPVPMDAGSSAAPSGGDLNTFGIYTPKKPIFTMGWDGKIHAAISQASPRSYFFLPVPKGYNLVKDLLSGASLIQLSQSLKPVK